MLHQVTENCPKLKEAVLKVLRMECHKPQCEYVLNVPLCCWQVLQEVAHFLLFLFPWPVMSQLKGHNYFQTRSRAVTTGVSGMNLERQHSIWTSLVLHCCTVYLCWRLQAKLLARVTNITCVLKHKYNDTTIRQNSRLLFLATLTTLFLPAPMFNESAKHLSKVIYPASPQNTFTVLPPAVFVTLLCSKEARCAVKTGNGIFYMTVAQAVITVVIHVYIMQYKYTKHGRFILLFGVTLTFYIHEKFSSCHFVRPDSDDTMPATPCKSELTTAVYLGAATGGQARKVISLAKCSISVCCKCVHSYPMYSHSDHCHFPLLMRPSLPLYVALCHHLILLISVLHSVHCPAFLLHHYHFVL